MTRLEKLIYDATYPESDYFGRALDTYAARYELQRLYGVQWMLKNPKGEVVAYVAKLCRPDIVERFPNGSHSYGSYRIDDIPKGWCTIPFGGTLP